jgi:hypothetical protein
MTLAGAGLHPQGAGSPFASLLTLRSSAKVNYPALMMEKGPKKLHAE